MYLNQILKFIVLDTLNLPKSKLNSGKHLLAKEIFLFVKAEIFKQKPHYIFNIEKQTVNDSIYGIREDSNFIKNIIQEEKEQHKRYGVSKFYIKQVHKFDVELENKKPEERIEHIEKHLFSEEGREILKLEVYNVLDLPNIAINIKEDDYMYKYCLMWVLSAISIVEINKILDDTLTFFSSKKEMVYFLSPLIEQYKRDYEDLFPKENVKQIKRWIKSDYVPTKQTDSEVPLQNNKKDIAWLNKPVFVKTHFIKFLLKHYFKNTFTDGELTNVLTILLNNKIPTRSNSVYQHLSANKKKATPKAIKEGKDEILKMIDDLSTHSTKKDKETKSEKKKEELKTAFIDYWKFRKD